MFFLKTATTKVIILFCVGEEKQVDENEGDVLNSKVDRHEFSAVSSKHVNFL
jgi:hypothetical protein